MKKDKVEAILNIARLMFDKYGVQKTNMDEIASLSKVAKATIYHYFGSKEQVYMEVLTREVSNIAIRLTEAVDRATSPVDKLRAFIFTSFKLLKETADILNLRSDLVNRLLPCAGDVRKKLFLAQTSILQAVLKKGVEEGIFVSCGPNTVRSIVYAMRGFEFTWLLDSDNAEIDADLDKLFRLLCGGILNAKSVLYV